MPCHDPVRVRMPVLPWHVCHVRRTQDLVISRGRLARTLSARDTGVPSQGKRDKRPGSRPLSLSNTVDLFGRLPLSGSLKIRCSICIAPRPVQCRPKTVSGYPLGALQARHQIITTGEKKARQPRDRSSCLCNLHACEEMHRPNSWCGECDAMAHGEASGNQQ